MKIDNLLTIATLFFAQPAATFFPGNSKPINTRFSTTKYNKFSAQANQGEKPKIIPITTLKASAIQDTENNTVFKNNQLLEKVYYLTMLESTPMPSTF